MSWLSRKKHAIEPAREREAERLEREQMFITKGNESMIQQKEIQRQQETNKAEDQEFHELLAINERRFEEKTTKDQEKLKAAEGLKYVLDTAQLECMLCSLPQGVLKVNYDTPTIQDKKIATVKENDATSLIFTGNCKKSPQSAAPCASVMDLANWQDTGSGTVQDETPLLLKSTILCNYGGATIKITDSAQRCSPVEIQTTGVPVPDYIPIIQSVQWLNQENTIIEKTQNLKISYGTTDYLQEHSFSNMQYGEWVKLLIHVNQERRQKDLTVVIQSNTGTFNLDLGTLTVNENWEIETPFFQIPILQYNEADEVYHYNKYCTVLPENRIQKFYAVIEQIPYQQDNDMLKPFTYRRNYEELIGLFHMDDSGTKDAVENYENLFIGKNPEILTIVEEFSEFINMTEELIIEQIQKRIAQDAEKLWDTAVRQVQNGNLDDRPLYWARNKMQVLLKRHPLFQNDIDWDKNRVIKGTELDQLLLLFEEKSRNYTGIDFSKVPIGTKKLLITGFDPFLLNPDKEGNILQSNPSGVSILALHGKTIGDYYIQTFIFPVRYKDFDQEVIEIYFLSFIKELNMIITMSQGDIFRFDVDRFPCKNRGGYMDNLFGGNETDSYNYKDFNLISEGDEFYETTLPYKKIVPDENNPSDTFYIYFNQTFNQEEPNGDNDKDSEGTELRAKLKDIQKMKSIKGSGGNYLSNEIFYRVARMRTKFRPNLATGHLHIPIIQHKGYYEYYNNLSDLNKKMVKNKIRNIEKITLDINHRFYPLLIDSIKEIINSI